MTGTPGTKGEMVRNCRCVAEDLFVFLVVLGIDLLLIILESKSTILSDLQCRFLTFFTLPIKGEAGSRGRRGRAGGDGSTVGLKNG